ncbi:MAG: isoleucine--tRNA ligase [candidate division Zixibacteria bacterium]|nr:isoleucine--tRNA ligase [candidate division Zixibacteria bacterium]
MKFDQLKDGFSWTVAEEKVLENWEKNRIFEKSIERAEGKKPFIFFEGPPTANGKPGIHHVISRTIKDLMCRYKTMQGFKVDRKGGWDTHGLPVEVEVEKRLKLKNKQDIKEYGVAEFNKRCKESVFTYKKEWDQITRRIGYWLDLDKAYITLENYYIESVWHILENFFNRDLIYEGHKTIPFCPRCETGLSSHEVSQAYSDVSDPSVYVKMKSLDGDYSYLVWTTTPWTLPSNAAICFHPDETYVRVKHQDEELVMAAALCEKVLGEEYEVLEKYKGSDFAGKKYQSLFDTFASETDKAFYALNADFVTMEDGTGIVHIAPGFGADDYAIGKQNGLPLLQAIHENGHFKEDTGWLAGKYIKDADPEIIKDLKKRGLLYKSEKYTHSYPFCWRCDSPLIYIARKSWYIKTTQFKDKMLENNKKINWYPPEIGSGRFGEWLENNIDWSLSRERFWGTPLPIWICGECGEKKAIGSVAQLKELGDNVPDEMDLHKPYIDDIKLKCPSCSGKMERVPEVIDVWFDSGAMPFAQWHYPFENKEKFDTELYPAAFISEAVDQTRGWFYSLLAISTIFYDKPCFENCIVIEFIVDKDGKKMSKHVGNVVSPFEMVDKFGADSVRWYMISTSHPWISLKFDADGVSITRRKFFDTLKNCYAFWALYANIDDVADNAAKENIPVGDYLRQRKGDEKLIDRWVWSKYNTVAKQVTEAFDNYNVTRATRLIQEFVIDDLSNWYIRLNRSRFYGSGDDPDKFTVYSLLYDILKGVCGLMAPVAPFFSDYIYSQLAGVKTESDTESVHLTNYPVGDDSVIDETLENEMAFVKKVVSLALAARKRKNLKVRQPLPRIIVSADNGVTPSENVSEIILQELNIKNLEFAKDASRYISFSAKPNFAKLGPKFGKGVKQAASIITSLASEEVEKFSQTEKIKIDFDGNIVELTTEEIEIIRSEQDGFAVEADGPFTVVLDTTLSDELIKEGFARELVNKIQNKRKSSDFEVTDRIIIKMFADNPVADAVNTFGEYISSETLAEPFTPQTLDGNGEAETLLADGTVEELKVNGEKTLIGIERVK